MLNKLNKERVIIKVSLIATKDFYSESSELL